MSRLPHYVNNLHIDGGEAITFARRQRFTPQEIPDIYFYLRLSQPQGCIADGRIKSIKKPMTSSVIEPATLRLTA
jgi:hypothetical protein